MAAASAPPEDRRCRCGGGSGDRHRLLRGRDPPPRQLKGPAAVVPSAAKRDALAGPNTTPTRKSSRIHGTRPRTAQRPAPTTHAKTRPTRKSARANAPKAPSGFVPSRVWGWAPGSGAASYAVTFFHDDRPVFSTRASKPRLVLPSSFRYAVGRYRWTAVRRRRWRARSRSSTRRSCSRRPLQPQRIAADGGHDRQGILGGRHRPSGTALREGREPGTRGLRRPRILFVGSSALPSSGA